MTYVPPDPHNSAVPGTPVSPIPPVGAPVPYSGQAQLGPAGQPPKRGLPAWAWVVLSIVAALFLGIIIALAVLVPRMISEFADASKPVLTESAPEPTEQLDPDDSAAGTRFSLDDEVMLAAGPFWGIEQDPAWTIDIFDVEGVNQFSNAAAGCMLYTFQGPGVPDAAVMSSDRAATGLTVPVASRLGLPWDLSSEPTVNPDGSLDLDLDFGPDTVEMQRLSANYTTTSGEARERAFLMRAFLPANNVLMAQVDCPAGSPAIQDRLDALSITQY